MAINRSARRPLLLRRRRPFENRQGLAANKGAGQQMRARQFE